ncbi:cadherin-related family member 5 isoform X2 [Rattus rattus]|uniref:cadherin-related family member 5 isoform X2 n=1 Tax=Rattus rattus TaxID=10117 RepID=UPI0013F366D3|nr:cadherin-related family member 5 isoform X2 [Rattus rattus]
MGAPALLWPPLLLPLLVVLFGHLPGTLAQAQVCSANQTVFTMNENTTVSGPLAHIFVPEDQHVTLGQLSTPNAFRVDGDKLFLTVTPDYEENSLLEAVLECKRGNTLVTQLRVFVVVLDINDNAPEFPFTIKEYNVSEDTRVNTTVIPETELKATDADKDDILVYTLQEVTPNASKFFSLVGINSPALKLDQTLDYYKSPNMTFRLLARDTREENVIPSHTATATVVLNVLPADLRTPWFLPCSFTDGYFCIQAQYHAVIPTGHKLPSPLILSPGPIYAVDGDQAINQPIVYSIMMGNTDDTFIINKDDGNLTMAKSIPSPMTFTLLVRAEQADMARYSVTQAVVEARDVTGNPLQFSQSLYFGTVVLGSEAGTAVKDKTFPSEILRIQAQYLGFPDLNSAVTYQVTNSSEFIMNKDILLTTVPMETERTIRIEVEANNTVTKDRATTIVEIQVSEREPPSTGVGELGDGQRFSTVDMAVLGGVLGALLLLALIFLVILIHKHYRHRFTCCSGKAKEPQPSGYDNLTFLPDNKAKWSPTSNRKPEPGPEPVQPPLRPPSPMSSSPTPPSSMPPSPQPKASGSPKTVQAGDSPSAVRSILTKERRPEGEGGYKAVWFGKDIGAEADVVVLNEPTADVDSASASGSEGSDDDDDPDQKKSLRLGADADNTYV